MVGMVSWRVAEQVWRKGPWTPEEDKLLAEYVRIHGEGRWPCVAHSAGLNRSGKSCRLRWVNYLRPGLKKGQITPQEEGIIIELHALWGNKWSTIARYLPGRTDNEIKNYWRTHFKKKAKPSQKQEKRIKTQVLQEKKQKQLESDCMTNMNFLHAEVCSKEKIMDTQGMQEMVLMYPPMEEPCWPLMYQDIASWPSDTICIEDGLWNLDDHPLDFMIQTSHDFNKTAIQNQAIAYSCEKVIQLTRTINEAYIF